MKGLFPVVFFGCLFAAAGLMSWQIMTQPDSDYVKRANASSGTEMNNTSIQTLSIEYQSYSTNKKDHVSVVTQRKLQEEPYLAIAPNSELTINVEFSPPQANCQKIKVQYRLNGQGGNISLNKAAGNDGKCKFAIANAGTGTLELEFFSTDAQVSLQGETRFRVRLRSQPFQVNSVVAQGWDNTSPPYRIVVEFNHPDLGRIDALESQTAYELKRLEDGREADSGVTLRLSRGSRPSQVVFTIGGELKPGRYLLKLRTNRWKDRFGIPLRGNVPGGSYYTYELFKPDVQLLAVSQRGVTSATGPYVEYPEFTPPRKVPLGFNPHDKVETRVVRLYYFRDAHRAAQIINRTLQSYNRARVDSLSQLADQARRKTAELKRQRELQRRLAVLAAQHTREVENRIRALQRQLERTLQDLNEAQAGAQGGPGEEGQATDQSSRIETLEAVVAGLLRRIEQEQARLPALRQAEAEAAQELQRLQDLEEHAAKEQFRLEVAAAKEDPDSYAPGRPRSDDPVRQVSISVVGQGLIHLRGPIKGINIIRQMIHQLDAPVAQVRIGVHTVQINGERADRMEQVAMRVQAHIDHARFLSMQSCEMLRQAVANVAGRYQGDLAGFFGMEFIRQLRQMDSEFLHSGNKVLSLHPTDTTSLSSALMLLALAQDQVREEIWEEFHRLLGEQLPPREQEFIQAAMTGPCVKTVAFWEKHHHPFPLLAQNARFTSLRGVLAPTQSGGGLTPAQREMVRLAQILKARLVIEREYKQRVMERALIEERIDLDIDARMRQSMAAKELEYRESLLEAVSERAESTEQVNMVAQAIFQRLKEWQEDIQAVIRPNRDSKAKKVQRAIEKIKAIPEMKSLIPRLSREKIENPCDQSLSKKMQDEILKLLKIHELGYDIRKILLEELPSEQRRTITAETIKKAASEHKKKMETFYRLVRQVLAALAQPEVDAAKIADLRDRIESEVENLHLRPDDPRAQKFKERVAAMIDELDNLLAALGQVAALKRQIRLMRRPLDQKKLLDYLIDDLEEQYVELLEGTRAHVANIDHFLKRLTTALDDDLNNQFYYPTFRYIRQASTHWDVHFGQTETTTVLVNNRGFAKVVPGAVLEFDLPARRILMAEALQGAAALMQDVGALTQSPEFLGLVRSQLPGSTATPGAGSLGGRSAVRNVLPSLPSETAERLLAQNPDSPRRFAAELEALIPDPAIYKFETGTGFELRPVVEPDGQAVVFEFHYTYTTDVREPVRADEKHLARVKRHFIHTDVQLSNFELREISRYTVALKAARTARGVPLLEDIPVAGVLFRPLPSQQSALQQNIVLGQATIFPTLFDLMGLRWAPVVADLNPRSLREREFVVGGRNRFLQNHVYDHTSHRVDEFLNIPEGMRRADLYRTQEPIPHRHPSGYQGPGLDLRSAPLLEGPPPSSP